MYKQCRIEGLELCLESHECTVTWHKSRISFKCPETRWNLVSNAPDCCFKNGGAVTVLIATHNAHVRIGRTECHLQSFACICFLGLLFIVDQVLDVHEPSKHVSSFAQEISRRCRKDSNSLGKFP